MKYVLGLGGNLGNRVDSLRAALAGLGWGGPSERVRPLLISPIYESDAMLPSSSEEWSIPYLNIALLCESALEPLALLAHLKSVEQELGRKNRARWAPREIDLDILAMEGPDVMHPDLKVPHPGLLERPFALLPLSDVTPHWKTHGGRTYAELSQDWRRLPADQVPYRTRRSRRCLVRLAAVINLTPDSFSGDGELATADAGIIERAEKHIREGAEVLDLGAESTRPGATPMDAPAEWGRLEGPLTLILSEREKRAWKVKVSVDTRHPETAEKAIALGVDCINDVGGGSNRMISGVAKSQAKMVIMHSLSVPASAEARLSQGSDPVHAVKNWAESTLRRCENAGLPRSRIELDPGIGFGKSTQQNWELIKRLGELRDWGCSIYVGHSRKGFLSLASDQPASDRDVETATLSVELARRGAHCLRVHNVGASARALSTWAILEGVIDGALL